MAEPRQTRDMETRAAVSRKTNYSPPSTIPEVPEKDGWKHRWIRTSIVGKADNTNVSTRFREGWEPAPKIEYPTMHVMTDRDSRFPDNIEVGGLLLCRAPDELMQSRAQYYADRAAQQTASVDHNLMRENDPRMPLFKETRSSVSFGTGRK